MNVKDKRKFLENNIDFPFYNDIPKLSNYKWFIIFLSVIISISLIVFSIVGQNIFPIVFSIVTIIPAAYVFNGNYGLMFKKPGINDLKIIILCLVLYYLYTIIIANILLSSGYHVSSNAVLSMKMDWIFYVSIIVQIFGEELFKVFLLLLVMYVVYKLSSNRMLSIYLAIIVTLLTFGLIHIGSYGKILQILLVQGLGGIFNLYVYLKTKNVIASYILHFLIDFIPFALLAL